MAILTTRTRSRIRRKREKLPPPGSIRSEHTLRPPVAFRFRSDPYGTGGHGIGVGEGFGTRYHYQG